MTECDLCALPTPDPPVTDDDVDGSFCCRGCLEVARQLDGTGAVPDDRDDEFTDDIREALGTDSGSTGGSARSATTETTFLGVDGMHCTTCEAFIEGTLTGRDGIVQADASYASELVKVEYDPGEVDPAEMPAIVSTLGYEAHDLDEETATGDDGQSWRLVVGIIFAMVAMPWYLTLYPTYLGLVPEPRGGIAPLALGIVWLAASAVLLYTGFPILRSAYVSLRAGHPNMDLLITLAAVGAYLYSTTVIVLGGIEVYFDITIVVVLVVTLGNRYEDRIKRRAIGSLADLTEERVDKANRRDDGTTEQVHVADLEAGDEVVVKPGERIPVDGTVVEGTAAVDESLLTGESNPVQKTVGDDVIGGAIVTDNAIVVEVGEGGESTLDRLVTLLWNIQSSRPGAQRLADRIATVFVPLVLLLAVVAFAWQLATGTAPTEAWVIGLSVLIVACPCALGLATPLAIASGIRSALDVGIVITNESVFEMAGQIDVILLDKTGTLTTGEMHVVDPGDRETLRRAAAVEQYASHPIAEAIVRAAPSTDLPVSDFEQYPGHGVSANVDGQFVLVGTPDLFEEQDWNVAEDLRERASEARESGCVAVLVGWEGTAQSVIVAGDRPRHNWAAVVSRLAEGDRRIAIVTGDEKQATREFRDHPDVDEVFAGVPPEAKSEIVARLQQDGRTAMVGDGSNDAPALAAADLGIALESGTALAADAADIVVTTDDIGTLPTVFAVTTATKRRIRQNLGWAFCYNGIAIPVAMAGYLNPLIAALAMGISSLLVVSNSARSFPSSRNDSRDE